MNLTDFGFSNWQKWCAEAEIPKCCAVYAFRTPRAFGRVKGRSDIVYIGSGQLSLRLKSHRGKLPKADRLGRIQKSYRQLQVSWKLYGSKNEAKKEESRLLSAYQHEHLELPPVNRSVPEKDAYEARGRNKR
jgi:hypothetical protein